MSIYIFFAEGFEEVEALIPSDLFNRAGIEVFHVGVGDTVPIQSVKSAHCVEVLTPYQLEDVSISQADALVFPGGLPGSENLGIHPAIPTLIEEQLQTDGLVAAICAAPIRVLLRHGFLEGKRFTCFPGAFDESTYEGSGQYISDQSVVRDGNIITSQGVGTASHFAHAIISSIKGRDIADKVIEQTLLRSDWNSYNL